MKYTENWSDTQKRFLAWWNNSNIGRPIMRITAKRKTPLEQTEEVWNPKTPEDKHLEADRKVRNLRNFCKKHRFMAEAFPAVDINIGAGSMAAYLGAQPEFRWDTVWFKECVSDWEEWGALKYDDGNIWLKRHLEAIKSAKQNAVEDFLVTVPDIIENLDILAAMRGAQNLCYDLIDEPELIKGYISQLDELYLKYYDQFYNLVKDENGGSSYTIFSIWGPGKTVKVQCDFSAMLSPGQFKEFIVPSLQYQCSKMDFILYHLDGVDAVRHLDAIMGIEKINALQWTPGAGQPDAGSEKWYYIYDKVVASGKSLWIMFSQGEFNDWITKADNIVKRYGPEKLYFLFPLMEEEDAFRLLEKADSEWI